MVAELNILTEWIPEQMLPGTVFVLENAGEVGKNDDPYWAVLACPECGTLGLITRRQMAGITPVICGSDQCSARFFIRDEDVRAWKPNYRVRRYYRGWAAIALPLTIGTCSTSSIPKP